MKALLNQAVADRVRGERVGIFLSGGLDSTTIAGAAVRQNRSSEPAPVRGFTFVYESLIPDDERDATLAAADHLEIPVQFYVVDAVRDWEAFTEADTPEPSLGSMHGEPRQTCYADMAAHSRVALNGEGTDNALHYEWRAYLSFLRRTHRWTRIAADALIFLAHRRRPPLLHALMNGAARAGSDGTEPAIPSWMSIDLVERLQLARAAGICVSCHRLGSPGQARRVWLASQTSVAVILRRARRRIHARTARGCVSVSRSPHAALSDARAGCAVVQGQVSDALYIPRRSSRGGEEATEDAAARPSALRESSARRHASAGGLAPTRAVRFIATIRGRPVLAGSD